ncbi:hypothetical protein HNR06_002021 [Nocardiopsis arvandica]|uniref:DUF3558 domain-containing protein n=1 Tax=Nocardiopsis sinuspersici TaxID=501010 RepID=A0A7Y9XAX5_9ACTN|nr:hypothetical protein [Nocardiopsis sinuspersici]
MSPAPRTPKSAAALAAGLLLLLTACGGGEPEQAAEAPDAAAADTEEAPAQAPRETAELRDPVEMAPDNLCTVLSGRTLDGLLGAEDLRSDPQATTGTPDPQDLEEFDRLRMSCLLVSAGGAMLRFDMEVHEGPYVGSTLPVVTEEEADPGVGLGDFAVTGTGGDGAEVTVVEGQVLVYVDYSRMGGGDEDEMLDGALLAAEELLASVG